MIHSDGKKHIAHKQVSVTHVHAKPHRKRHYAILVASIALGVSSVAFLFSYLNQEAVGRAVASQTIESIFGARTTSKAVPISSSYGFTIAYNAKHYYASAIDADTGGLYVGDELSTTRAYDTIRLSTQATGPSTDANSIRVNYYPHDAAMASAAEVEKRYVVDKQTDASKLTKMTSTTKNVQGVDFQRTEWSRSIAVGKLTLQTTFVTYSANVNDHPFTVIVYEGTQSAAHADDFIDAITFSDNMSVANLAPTASAAAKHSLAEQVIDTILGVQIASAASSTPSYTASERVSATYGPAVVKIYNVYIADLTLDGEVLYRDYLSGGTGSGFIVSGDGYIATNGHVVVNDAREETISYSLELVNSGDTRLLSHLIDLTSLQESDIAGRSSSDVQKIVIEALYTIDKSHFAFTNTQTNLLVGLGDKQVDVEELVSKTKSRRAYTEQDTIKKATVVDFDYEGIIRPSYTQEFVSSDVALIKLASGDNYPMIKLGVMSDAAQGSNINIMGFPGTGSSSNGIVSKTVTSATLTTGKVSAQKKDSAGRSIIETDTEIGHGNSGGPAFTDSGDVIGIATYSSDSGDAGDGVLNYVRDIADFAKLADKKYVNYKTTSNTQKAWDEAIELFYQAHYKSAVSAFKKVQQLYPDHPQVAAMIVSSEKHIANGDNIDEFPVVLVAIVSVVALIGTVGAVIVIIMHNKKHRAYVHGVTTGQIPPLAPGMSPQSVTIAPSPLTVTPVLPTMPTAPVTTDVIAPVATAPESVAPPVVQVPPAPTLVGQPPEVKSPEVPPSTISQDPTQ